MGEESPGETTQHGRRLRARHLWIALVALVLLVPLAFVLFSASARARRDAALERIRTAGEPVLPEDIVCAELEGADPRPWLEELDALEAPYWYLRHGSWFLERSIEELESEEVQDEEALDLLRRLRVVYAELGDDDAVKDFWDGVDHLHPGSVDDDQLLALELEALQARPFLALFDDACGYAPLDPRESVEAGADLEALVPMPPAGLLALGRTKLLLAAPFEAADGRPEKAVLLLERALCAASIGAEVEWLLPYAMWTLQVDGPLFRLKHVLALSPSGTDFADLERRIRDLPDARDKLRRSLVGERAFLNRTFAWVEDGGSDESLWGVGFLYRLFVVHDHAALLDDFDDLLAAVELPYGEARWEIEALVERAEQRWTALHFLSKLVYPVSLRNLLENATLVEARRSLALVALAGFQSGEDAAREAAERHPDPFAGAPLGMRVEPDGVLVLWSVGPNLVDEGGDPSSMYPVPGGPPRDLVWRVRLP